MLKCGVCSQNVKHTEEFSATRCGYFFHSKCAYYCRSQHRSSCSVCPAFPSVLPKVFVTFDSPAENEERDEENATLKKNLEVSQSKCAEFKEKMKNLRTENKAMEEHAIESNVEMRNQIAKNIELEEQLDMMKKNVDSTLKERDEEIAALKKNLEGSQYKCAEFQEKMRNLRTDIEAMEKSNLEQYAKDFELQEKFNEMNKSYQKMRNQIGKNIELEEQLDEIKEKVGATVKDKDDEIAALKKSLEQSQKKSGALQEVGSFELQEQIAAMQKFLEETQNKCTELQEKVKHSNTQHENIQQGQPGFTKEDGEDLLMRVLDLDAINLDNNAASSAEKPRSNSKEVTAVCQLKPEEVKTLQEAWLAYVRDKASKVNMKQWKSILKPKTTNGGIINKPAPKATPAIIKIHSTDHENKAPATSQPTESKINPGVCGGAHAKPIKQALPVSTEVIVSRPNE